MSGFHPEDPGSIPGARTTRARCDGRTAPSHGAGASSILVARSNMQQDRGSSRVADMRTSGPALIFLSFGGFIEAVESPQPGNNWGPRRPTISLHRSLVKSGSRRFPSPESGVRILHGLPIFTPPMAKQSSRLIVNQDIEPVRVRSVAPLPRSVKAARLALNQSAEVRILPGHPTSAGLV